MSNHRIRQHGQHNKILHYVPALDQRSVHSQPLESIDVRSEVMPFDMLRYGNLELIEFLFEKGMKPNIQSIYNHVSILHCAVYSGEVSILAYVLNNVFKNANPTNC